jgi:hypothetical protein
MAGSSITRRKQDFDAWDQDVAIQGDMAEPAEIVKSWLVVKPNEYSVWEIRNCYFGLPIRQTILHGEAGHTPLRSGEMRAMHGGSHMPAIRENTWTKPHTAR